MVAKLAIFSCLVAAAASVAVPVHPVGKIAYAPAPTHYAPAPAHYAHAPVHYAPAPVHYAPAPVHYAPAPVKYAAPITKLAYAEAEAPAHYDFEYSVHDTHTGDIKQQKESRSGDAVHGSYSLVQPDGVHRIVEYTSDKINGFNANVRYEGTPIETPHVAKVLAAPVAKVAYAPAPVHYAPAPVAKVAYAPAPVQYAHAPAHYAPAPAHYAPASAHYAPAHFAPAPVHYAAAPVAKLAYAAAPVAKVAYASAPAHVSFSSPAVSYHH